MVTATLRAFAFHSDQRSQGRAQTTWLHDSFQPNERRKSSFGVEIFTLAGDENRIFGFKKQRGNLTLSNTSLAKYHSLPLK